MYLPKHFESNDLARTLEIVESYPFATVMSFDEKGAPFFSHVPLMVKNLGSGFSLVGHMAKRNPQWLHFKNDPRAKVIIHGPHAYITPTWYRSGRDVPTWNYVSIHIGGVTRLIEDFDSLVGLLKGMTAKFEEGSPSPWEFELPDDLSSPDSLCSAIFGFEITAENVEAKFKLSQNRNDADKTGVIAGLGERKDDMSHAIRELMLKTDEPKGRT